MPALLRFLPAFLVLILLVSMMERVQNLQSAIKNLPLTGDSICSQYPRKIKKRCNSLIARSHFDPVAANLCIGHGKEVDFECLVQVSNSQFQLDMLSLCVGQDSAYLRLCLMALRNKVYSESERNLCGQEIDSPYKVYCLARFGHRKT